MIDSKITTLCLAVTFGVLASGAVFADIVSFKDAAKIKSWDAWNDHKGVQPKKERRSVTWEKLQKLDCGLEPAGTLATRHASEIKSSK